MRFKSLLAVVLLALSASGLAAAEDRKPEDSLREEAVIDIEEIVLSVEVQGPSIGTVTVTSIEESESLIRLREDFCDRQIMEARDL